MAQVSDTVDVKAEVFFSGPHVPSDAAALQAYRDLEAYIQAHPVLSTGSFIVTVEIGGQGGD